MLGSSVGSSAVVDAPAPGSSVVDSSAIAPSVIESGLRQLAPERLRAALANFLPQGATAADQTSAIEAGLRSPAGQAMRDTMARWIVDEIVPVDRLVPKAYENWRPPVRDAMMFVVARLSPARLAPKLLEQLELPLNTSAEVFNGSSSCSRSLGARRAGESRATTNIMASRTGGRQFS